MALSGSLSNPFRTGYRIQIDWSATQNVGANTSTITANFYLISTGSGYNINASAAKALSIVIDGTTYSYSVNVTVASGQTKLLATATHTLGHNADGTRSFAISASLGINVTLSGTYYGTVSIAAVGFALNTIPRTSNPTVSAASVIMGNSVAIYTNRASTAFSHNLSYSINGNVALIATGVTDSFSWVPPATLASLSPNSASAVCYIVCDTYSGGTYIGSSTTAFTIIVPDTIVPTISSVTIAEAVAGIAAKFSGYVQYQSKVNVTIAAAGASGSTITAYSTTILGLTYPGSSFVSGFLSTSGTVAVVTTVTDSRGRQKSVTNNITVIPYFNPSISLFTCQRCLASGTPNEDGTSLYANIKFDVAAVNSKNDKSWKIEYRISGSGSWTLLTSGSIYTYNAIYKELTGKFSIDNAYELKLTITDYFGSISTTVTVATAFTLLDFSASGKGFAIGQVSTIDAFEVSLPTVHRDKVYLSNDDKLADKDIDKRLLALEGYDYPGRNYFINSRRTVHINALDGYTLDHPDCPYGFFLTGNQSGVNFVRLLNVIDSNGYWTVSWDMRGSQNAAVGLSVDICDQGQQRFVTNADNTWKRYYLTVNVTNAGLYNFVDFQDLQWAYFYIKNIKVEKGSIATPWEPAIEEAPARLQDNWIFPTLLNGWVNYNDGWNTTAYMKDELGFVHIHGLVRSGTIDRAIFKLPIGYRPFWKNIFTMIAYNAIGRVDVRPDGDVHVWPPTSNAWVPLDNISFKAEQ